MKISVCIATYNGEKYIKEQLDSILCQIGEDAEVIISDDGSTDKTLKIIREYNDKRIKIFINTVKKGFTHNFENAIKQSSGDYIFLSDQDDVWLPNKVEYILKYIQEDTLVLTDAWMCDKNLNLSKQMSQWRTYKKGYLTNLYKSNYLGCSMAFSKQMLLFFLPIPKKIIYGHDTWFGLLAELKYKILYLKEPMLYYRRHPNTITLIGKSKSKYSFLFMAKYRLYFLYYTLKRYILKK